MSTLAQSVSSYWCKPVSQRLGQSIPYYPVHTSCKPPIRRRPYQARATMSQSKTVLVPIANGSEEMEAVITIDVLRRCVTYKQMYKQMYVPIIAMLQSGSRCDGCER